MDPRQFLRILAVRWPIVAALVVLGATVGWVTTPDATTTRISQDQLTLWQATNLQFLPTSGNALTPAQIAFFATFDEVPRRVADRLGGDPEQLVEQVTVTDDPEIGLLRISSTNVDPRQAEALANTFAEELRLWLDEQAAASQAERRDAVLERIATLEAQIAALDEEIDAASGTQSELLTAERDGVFNQLRLERERFESIAAEGLPGGVLRPAQDAEATPINGPAYYESLLRSTGADATTSTTRPRGGEEPDADSTADGRGLPDDFPVQPAVRTSRPNPLVRAGVGAAAGAVVGLGIVAALAAIDRKIRTRSDAEGAFRLPVLTEVPELPRHQQSEVVSWTHPHSTTAEAHRSLRTALALSGDAPAGDLAVGEARELTVVMITSPTAGDGKSTTVANLAAVLAEAGKRVLILDCDFRRPRLAKLLGVRDLEPLGDQPASTISGDPRRFYAQTPIDRVFLAQSVGDAVGSVPREHRSKDTSVDASASGAERPAAIIAAQRRFLQAVRYEFDVVLLDTAPVRSINDAADLLPSADGVLFVARVGRTDLDDAEAAAERFERLGAPMLGVVLLGGASVDAQSNYYYNSSPAASNGMRRRWPLAARSAG